MFQDYDFQGYIDAYSFIEFSSGQTIINILKTKMFVNCQDKNDLELRKMVPVDMTLIEAYEDGILEDNSFDMI